MGALPSTRHSSGSQLHWHSWPIDGTCPYVQVQSLGDLYTAHLQDKHTLLQPATVIPLTGQGPSITTKVIKPRIKGHHSRFLREIITLNGPRILKVQIRVHCCV